MNSRNSKKERNPDYLNKNIPIEKRVEDLLKRMTIAEKIYQMVSISNFLITWSGDNFLITWKDETVSIPKEGLGQLSKGITHFTPKTGAKRANEVQKLAREQTRLGIPIIIHDECLHGCVALGSTSFPQSIALASTWDEKLMKEIAKAIGKETKARGISQCLSPTINIARDPRCGRTEETYGEDPFLTSRMAVAFVRGIQSQGVAATPKHFAANFVGDGGRDSNAIHLSERILREIYFPAFEACVKKANALSIMAAYNSLDGIPCSSNKWLLTDVLRKEWGFKGFVVSDYFSVAHIYEKHKVAETKAEAAKQAVEAGLDIELPNIDCYAELIDLVEKNKISVEAINECVRRVLRVKFWLGLFDNPYVDPEYAEKICDCTEHRGLALKAAQKSIVLLKNNDNILPLGKNVKSIAVIGPNANEIRLGGYSCGEPISVVTPLEGIKNRASKNIKINSAQGCTVDSKSKKGFKSAVNIAKNSDVAILFMGNSNKTEGEDRDRSNLDLPGMQEELIKEISKTGTPVIIVLINGSAITMSNWINRVQAVIEAWYPGEEGGNAIADILFGNCNPGGHLPITFPKTTGQLPLYYNYKPSGRSDDYVDLRGEQPLFPFGYGLSYTKFKFGKPRLEKTTIGPNESTRVIIDVTNIGNVAGDEVVQMYIHDKVSSLARPVKELKGFQRITLIPGQTKTVFLDITPEHLAFYDIDMKYVVEPGEFEIMVGSSSHNEDLQKILLYVKA
jgi:beta-glucosidase